MPKAMKDLQRVQAFYARVEDSLAERTVEFLMSAPDLLLDTPRIGKRLEEYDPREVRRLIVGGYEMRYEIKGDTIFIVRLWHTREDRTDRCPPEIHSDNVARNIQREM